MSKATPEGQVKKEIKVYLDALPYTWYFMPWGSESQQRGIPDFAGLTNGRFWVIEAKATAKQRPTLLQKLCLAQVRRARGIALVIHSENLWKLHELRRLLD